MRDHHAWAFDAGDRSGSMDDSGDDHSHDHHSHDASDVGVAVLTVSSSRSLDDDPSGDAIEELLTADDGTHLAARGIVPDERAVIRETVESAVDESEVDAVVTTGGTGITPDDETIEAVEGLFEKELPGFGEQFRRRSEPEIGMRTVGTRATAGVADGAVVFCLPGSENAVRLGVGEIVLPVVGHLVGLASR
jgi:molybdenum cofactor biosynthesis protein B